MKSSAENNCVSIIARNKDIFGKQNKSGQKKKPGNDEWEYPKISEMTRHGILTQKTRDSTLVIVLGLRFPDCIF